MPHLPCRAIFLGLTAMAILAGCGAAASPGAAKVAAKGLRAKGAESPERQTEFRLGLTEAGYAKLKQAWRWEDGGQRHDLYFDAYDGHGFKLKYGNPPLKVRVKLKGDKAEWQVSRVASKQTVSAGSFGVGVAVTDAWEVKLKGKEAKPWLEASEAFFQKLEAGGAPLRAQGEAADRAWRDLADHVELPGVQEIGAAVGGRAFKLFPAATNSKRRLETMLDLNGGVQLSVLLGVTEARDEQGRQIKLYELEAEPETALAQEKVQDVARAFGGALAQIGVTEADMAGPSPDAYRYTQRQLEL